MENTPLVLPGQKFFTLEEAAAYMRRSPTYLRTLIHDRQLKAIRSGHAFLLDRTDIDAYLEKLKVFQAPYRTGTRPKTAERWAKYRAKKQKKAGR